MIETHTDTSRASVGGIYEQGYARRISKGARWKGQGEDEGARERG
jgi:hypothetical protein